MSPENAVLAISGDVDEKELKGLVEQLFSDWKGKSHELRKEIPELPATGTYW